MITVSSNEAKQSFGRMLDSAQREPVIIQKHKRSAAVMLSVTEYERLRGMNVGEFADFCNSIGERAQRLGLTQDKLHRLLANE